MEQDIASPRNEEPASPTDELTLFWSRRMSLTPRILAVNIFAIALLAGSFFYLDSYRERLVTERMMQAEAQTWTIAQALPGMSPAAREAFLVDTGRELESRYRIYDGSGDKTLDSFSLGRPSYQLRDPDAEPLRKDIARLLDRAMEGIAGARTVEDYREPDRDVAASWPELRSVRATGESAVARFRYARDRTPMISAASPIPGENATLLMTYNARDVTRYVRDERGNLAIILGAVTIVSVLLSLFLARTIVRPLRRLARAAVRVRLGRAREVVVPRLPERGDEIGLLARALSDMSLALRKKIDATEAFAADVSHELKNPLASLRSALEGMERVKDPALFKQLMEIACNDVQRLDRLITDIAEASRVDAQLGRTRFEPIDLGEMIENLLAAREARNLNGGRSIAFARPRRETAVVLGEGTRLERVIGNLLDNAVSFAPANGLVTVSATRVDDFILLQVIDDGPGVAESEREAIFRRFHSMRPIGEDFGQHSGLGLAIARTIIEAHHGEINVRDRDDGRTGACFEIRLPAIAGQPIYSERAREPETTA